MLSNRAVQTRTLLDGVTIGQDTAPEVIVDLKDYSCAENRFVLEAKGTSGAGNVDLTYTVSIDGVTYFAPTDTALLTDLGTTAQRTAVAPFTPLFCRFLKFIFTEDDSGDLVGVNATLIMQ